MFEKVLVGVDGRVSGRDAIALALELKATDGRLILTYVSTADPHRVSDAAQYRDRARRLLEEERTRTGLDAELRVVAARSVGGGLHVLAEEFGADLLVVGSCSHGLAGRVLLGSDTHAALRDAPCAVAVAPQGYAAGGGSIHSIGVGYDESAESQRALSVARAVAFGHGASVTALDVVAAGSYAYGGLGAASVGYALAELLAQTKGRLQSLDGVSTRVVCGGTAEELVGLSQEVELLVLGSRRLGRLSRVLLGSTSEHVAQHARSAVLVVPRPLAPTQDVAPRRVLASQ